MKHWLAGMLALAAGLPAAASTRIELSCNRADAVCRTGEEVVFTLAGKDETGALVKSGTFNASVDNFGTKAVVPKRAYDFAEANPVVICGKLNEPGFLRINVVMPGVTNFLWSVAVSPEGIRPGAPCPDDFDAFWADEIAKYDAAVKEDVELTPVPQIAKAGFEAFKVSLSAPNGRKLYGILTRPADLSKGPYPLRYESKGAGPASNGFSGRPGRVTLCMNVHYYDAPVPSSKKENDKLQETENREWFGRFKAKRAGYQVLGIAGERTDYFYHDVILATRRVFLWAAKQPYVDAKDITYESTSQGGGFGLYMAALCPQIRKLAVFVPALTDLCGYRARRMSGWPRLIEEQLDENREKAAANAGYYDAVNFAARVRCPTRVTVGFSDDTCPPTAVYSAYNSLRVADKEIWHGIGMTHLVRSDLYAKGEAWLGEEPGGGRHAPHAGDEPSLRAPRGPEDRRRQLLAQAGARRLPPAVALLHGEVDDGRRTFPRLRRVARPVRTSEDAS